MEKECFCCKQTKPISDFYAHPKMSDGHLNKCKECVINDVKARRKNPVYREKILAYDRKRGNRQDYGYIKEYRSRYPNKYKAHTIVHNSIRDKKLFREPCEVCGSTEGLHAHHDDYLKPLNVRWLCAAHHCQWHAEHGEAQNP